MDYGIGRLVKEIDRESSQVVERFRSNKQHCNLSDFSRAISAYETLEGKLKSNSDASEVEAKVYGTIYSVLAFRMLFTSTRYDQPKFDKAEKIIERASKITMESEPSIHIAEIYLGRKLAEFSPQKIDTIRGHVSKFFGSLGYTLTNDFISLFLDIKTLFRVGNYFGRLRKDLNADVIEKGGILLGKSLYEIIRTAIFSYSSVSGIADLSKGYYESGLLKVGIAIALPLIRYIHRKRKMEEILGLDYQLPKLGLSSLRKQ